MQERSPLCNQLGADASYKLALARDSLCLGPLVAIQSRSAWLEQAYNLDQKSWN